MSKKPLLEMNIKNWIGESSSDWYVKQVFENKTRSWYTLSIYNRSQSLYRFNVVIDRRIDKDGCLEVVVGIRRRNYTLDSYSKWYTIPLTDIIGSPSTFIKKWVLPMESLLETALNQK